MFRVLVAVVITFASCSLSQAQVLLQRKFTPNTKHLARTQTSINQVLSIAGMDARTSAVNTSTHSVAIGERTEAGTQPVTVTFQSLQVQLTLPDRELQFDSANPNAGENNPFKDLFQAMTGVTLTYQVDESGKAIFVDGFQDAIHSSSETTAQMLKHLFNEENLREEFNQQTSRFPDTPVKAGDTWRRTEKVFIGGGQTLTFGFEFKYEGTVQKDGKTYHRITNSADTVSIAHADDAPGTARITSSDLKIKEWKGETLFDRDRGAVYFSESKGRIVGSMTLAFGNQSAPATLDLQVGVTTNLE